MSKVHKITRVTTPSFPPMDELKSYLSKIYQSEVLTNCGEIHSALEIALCNYLGVEHISLMSSGTSALMLAIKSLNLKGEVITSPYTSVSTIQAIYWNNLKPVFVDVQKTDCNIDVSEIEKAITPETSAILPIHVYGNPCKIDEIQKLATKYNLKVIYDAAHCFGVTKKNKSILLSGDISAISFHATKVFNTIEGGAVICKDSKTKKLLDALKNSGISSETSIAGYGLNAKLNEFQAAFGLSLLGCIDEKIENRRLATLLYKTNLKDVDGIRIISTKPDVKYNYTYFPIFIDSSIYGVTRDALFDKLTNENIFTRKYFYPLVSDYEIFKQYKRIALKNAEELSQNVICLPLFDTITKDQIHSICKIIRKR
ncbi:MAG: DegT/DnrJ/EryC1/StrS family aminotransferase [Bacteroidales bacterium]|nr:DegT/DnrJ/EryC1/StrS family aminotransferase [Bacteroidales bacterium]